jgi:hypothetical protein
LRARLGGCAQMQIPKDAVEDAVVVSTGGTPRDLFGSIDLMAPHSYP